MLPNFFIMGTQKGGTTSLHTWLRRHPDVFLPAEPQEIHFFDLEENYRRGLDWYERLFRGAEGYAAVGQTSPLYMYWDGVAERIARAVPRARLIFILRNPTERAYSHYWHQVKKGNERLSFHRAIEQEPDRIRKSAVYKRRYSYLDRGRYAAQIDRFRALFPPEQMLFLKFDELRSGRREVLRRAADFIGVDPGRFPDDVFAAPPENSARLPKSIRLQRLGGAVRDFAPRLGHLIDRVNLEPRAYPRLDQETRERLSATFAGERRRLVELTGLSFEEWR